MLARFFVVMKIQSSYEDFIAENDECGIGSNQAETHSRYWANFDSNVALSTQLHHFWVFDNGKPAK